MDTVPLTTVLRLLTETVPVDRMETKRPVALSTLLTDIVPTTVAVIVPVATTIIPVAIADNPLEAVVKLKDVTDTTPVTETTPRIVEILAMFWIVPVTATVPLTFIVPVATTIIPVAVAVKPPNFPTYFTVLSGRATKARS